jgi:hypothetical protein
LLFKMTLIDSQVKPPSPASQAPQEPKSEGRSEPDSRSHQAFDRALRQAQQQRQPLAKGLHDEEQGAAPDAAAAALQQPAALTRPSLKLLDDGADAETGAQAVGASAAAVGVEALGLATSAAALSFVSSQPVAVDTRGDTAAAERGELGAALSRLLTPASDTGLQHWQFSFGSGPLQSVSLQAPAGAPWQLALHTHAGRDRQAMAGRLDELRARLGQRGASVSDVTLDDEREDAPSAASQTGRRWP